MTSRAMSVLILSGGGASRMEGAEKGLLRFEDSTFIGKKIELLREIAGEIFIVTNDPEAYVPYTEIPEVKTIADTFPRAGALAALYTGLSACRYSYAFVTAADTPFLTAQLVRFLLSRASRSRVVMPRAETPDVVVPMWKGKLEPLCGVYAKRCTEFIAPCIERGEKKIRSFYPEAEVLYLESALIEGIDPDGRSFININTWDDYYTYFAADGRLKIAP